MSTPTTTAEGLPYFRHLLFVYGTLLRGENNYPYWLADPAEARFVSTARTCARYPFFINLAPRYKGCSPCVLDAAPTEASQRVEGELFLVSDKMRAWIDVLEDVAGGTYVVRDVAVEVLQPSCSGARLVRHLQQRQQQQQEHEKEKEKGGAPSKAEGAVVLTASMYCRARDYPADWAAAAPQDSTAQLARFRAADCLERYGRRFVGAPAHLRDDGGAAARALQRGLDLLPPSLRPSLPPPAASDHHDLGGAPLRPRPIVLVVLDGVGDNTYPELGGRTPLEVVAGVAPRLPPPTAATRGRAARPPRPLVHQAEAEAASAAAPLATAAHTAFYHAGINAVAAAGASGLLDPYLAGQSCGSDTAHLSLLGYPPATYYRGRGAYEALGAGLRLGEGDVAFKSNLSTWLDPAETAAQDDAPPPATAPDDHQCHQGRDNREVYVSHRRCDRDFTAEGPELCAALDGTVITADTRGRPLPYVHVVHVQYATEHRCGVAVGEGVQRNEAFAAAREVYLRKHAAHHNNNNSEDPGEAGDAAFYPYPDTGGALSDRISGTDPLKDGRYLRRCVPTVAPPACREEEGQQPQQQQQQREEGGKDGRDPRACTEYERAVYTCAVVEAVSQAFSRLLKAHPVNAARRAYNEAHSKPPQPPEHPVVKKKKYLANLVLLRGPAKVGWVPPFLVRHGRLGAIIAPTCIIKGLGICCGLVGYNFERQQEQLQQRQENHNNNNNNNDHRQDGSEDKKETKSRQATGDYQSDLELKVEAALELLRCNKNTEHNNHNHNNNNPQKDDNAVHYSPHLNFVLLHIKGIDDAGHDRDLYQKLAMLQRSAAALQHLCDALPAGSTVGVLADHSTPLFVGDHCCEPVPIGVYTKPLPIASPEKKKNHPPQHQEEKEKRGLGEGGEDEELFPAAFAFPCDGLRQYSECLAGTAAAGLGRLRGSSVLPLLKRANHYYHYE